jgi:hypothetical protein
MKVNSITEVLGLIVVLAIVTDIVTSKNSASIISAGGSSFGNVLKSAQGK